MIFGKKSVSVPESVIKIHPENSPILGKRRIQSFSDIEEGITQDKFSLFVLVFSIFSILLQVILILINWNKLPSQLPLFYSQPWGEKMLASPLFLGILPLIVLGFTACNYLILISVRESIFLRRIIVVFTFLVSFFCSYSLIKLLFLLI